MARKGCMVMWTREEFHLNIIKTHFTIWVVEHAAGCPETVVPISGNISYLSGHSLSDLLQVTCSDQGGRTSQALEMPSWFNHSLILPFLSLHSLLHPFQSYFLTVSAPVQLFSETQTQKKVSGTAIWWCGSNPNSILSVNISSVLVLEGITLEAMRLEAEGKIFLISESSIKK